MRVLALLLALADAPPDPVEGTIGVHWRVGEPESPVDAPDESLQAGLRERLAALDGRPSAAIQDRALTRARVAVSRELPAAIRAVHGELRAALDGADAAFREGRFVDAEQASARVLSELGSHPELPGAAAMAREAWLLAAAIAWAAGDRDGAEQALRAALVLDPEALLSTKRAPPELVARYRALQTERLAERETTWIEPTITVEPGSEIEIDGAPGLRRVPAGEHFVVVYREGQEPVARLLSTDEAWTVELGRERIADRDPLESTQAEALCRALELEVLVLAERRGPQVGLQAHRCGAGFGPRWIGERERLELGVAAILVGPFEAERSSLIGEWPPPMSDQPPPPTPDQPAPPRPWYRKGWVWGTSVGVLALVGGAIATGVVLGTRTSRAGLIVDANDFIGF
ncbi:hypothetical protein ACNOYE_27655 [Nannocystaceae bacterium ST9]